MQLSCRLAPTKEALPALLASHGQQSLIFLPPLRLYNEEDSTVILRLYLDVHHKSIAALFPNKKTGAAS